MVASADFFEIVHFIKILSILILICYYLWLQISSVYKSSH